MISHDELVPPGKLLERPMKSVHARDALLTALAKIGLKHGHQVLSSRGERRRRSMTFVNPLELRLGTFDGISIEEDGHRAWSPDPASV